MKKQYRILTAVLALTLVNAMPAAAQDVTVLMQEMNDIREDLKILQRQMYNDGGSELVVTVGRLDELVRFDRPAGWTNWIIKSNSWMRKSI